MLALLVSSPGGQNESECAPTGLPETVVSGGDLAGEPGMRRLHPGAGRPLGPGLAFPRPQPLFRTVQTFCLILVPIKRQQAEQVHEILEGLDGLPIVSILWGGHNPSQYTSRVCSQLRSPTANV